MSIDRLCYGVFRSVKTKAPTILSCLASAGVIATVVTAVKVTPEAVTAVKADSLKAHGDPHVYTKTEAVKSAWRYYIPSAAIGAGTIFCIFGANALNAKQQASLIASYKLLEASFKEYRSLSMAYRDKVIERFGEDREKEIRDEVVKECMAEDLKTCKDDEKPLFYDIYGRRYFNTSFEELIDAEYQLNKNFHIRGYVSLNEFYAFLGIDQIKIGETIGWDYCEMCGPGGGQWVDFDHELVRMDDGLECYVIRYLYEPRANEEDDDLYKHLVGADLE